MKDWGIYMKKQNNAFSIFSITKDIYTEYP